MDDSNCDVPCPGYGTQACGGIDFYTVYNTGIMLSVSSSEKNTSTSSSATPSVVASSTVVSGGQTSVVYVTSTPSSPPEEDKGGAPMGGIIAGVVVGVVVLGAAFGGLWFYMRQKRNREIEEEHRRNAAVNAFMGGKPPGSSGGYSMETDTRLDPVMAQRRMSSGSIADNQDYSRRILRVSCTLVQVSLIGTNGYIGYQRVMTFPIYDERLLPVLYSSIGIFRRLVNCSHVTGQSTTRRTFRRFTLAQGMQHIWGHEKDVAHLSRAAVAASYAVPSFANLSALLSVCPWHVSHPEPRTDDDGPLETTAFSSLRLAL